MNALMNREHLLKLFNNRYIADPISGCWLWLGYVNVKGYGILSVGSNPTVYIRAHKLAAHLFRGVDLEDESILTLHKCDVRCCVNPGHSYDGNQKQNVADRVARNSDSFKYNRPRVDKCKRGHDFDSITTVNGKLRQRRCNTCVREAYNRRKNSFEDVDG